MDAPDVLKRRCIDTLPDGSPCLELTTGTRCGRHETLRQQRRDAERGSPSARGHGYEYQRARKQLIGQPCALRLPGCTGTADTADYVIPWSEGGTINDGLQPACSHCNSVRGAQGQHRRGGSDL